MAQDRTNMVSLLDIGLLNGGLTSNIVELGDGFTELNEDWGANVQSTQYINSTVAGATVNGYALSMSPQREYLSDEVQEAIDNLFKTFPTGSKCESFYYRFYKTDITGSTGDCIRVPIVVAPSSTGGSAGNPLTSSLEIHGNGEAELGTITIASDGKYTWASK